jgi:hypothetical protein
MFDTFRNVMFAMLIRVTFRLIRSPPGSTYRIEAMSG